MDFALNQISTKLDYLNNCVNFFGAYETDSALFRKNYHELNMKKIQLINKIEILKKNLNHGKDLVREMNDHISTTRKLQNIIDETLENLPEAIIENISVEAIEMSPVVQQQKKIVKKIVECNLNTPEELNLSPITEVEFKHIPKYAVGRKKLEQINSFVDLFNQELTNKYSLLSKSIKSLNRRDQEKYKEYKRYMVENQLQDVIFLTTQDVATAASLKILDKNTINLINILRNLKRIVAVRKSKDTVYVVPNK